MASNSGPAGRRDVRVPLSQDQDEERVADRREHAEHDAEHGVVAVGAAADHARDQDDAARTPPGSRRASGLRPLAERRPGQHAHEHDLHVAEHRRQARAHRLDRVVPEREVGREQHARRPRRARARAAGAARSGGARPRRAARARAARRRSGRTPPWRAIPRRAGRGSPRRRSRARRARRRVRAGQSRAIETSRGYGAAPVDRDTVLWTLVVFFGASILFAAVRDATKDEGAGVRAARPAGRGRAARGGDRRVRQAPPVTRWIVDGMNVIGSRPTGWWRDRPRAMRELVDELEAFAAATRRGRDGRVRREAVRARAGGAGSGSCSRPRRGRNAADDDIAALVASDDEPGSLSVVTSDGDLARRARDAGAAVLGAGEFRRRLDA